MVQTLDAFFTDPNSAGMYASLSIMPADGNDNAVMCSVGNYVTGNNSIKVPLTLLDDTGTQLFLSMLCDPSLPQNPPCIVPGGGTPTRSALQGTLEYAASITQQYPNSKMVVVFLTDGEPGFGYVDSTDQVYDFYSCDDLTDGCEATPDEYPPCTTEKAEVDNVAGVISAAPAKSIYLIGVGDLSTNTMTEWATASGNPAIALQNTTGADAAAALSAALQTIRNQAASCNFNIPTPSGGAAVNVAQVNLSYANASGVQQDVRRTSDGTSATCNTSTLGWYFDNANAPTQIDLCPSTCADIRRNSTSALEVTFGCATLSF